MKKIIFYQSNFCQMGGVETMAYNWCWWLRNFFDITVLYCTGDAERLKKMSKLVKIEKYEDDKEYECDIFIRNSVWGKIPENIKAKRMIEMRHANYKWLLDKGFLYQQYAPMGIKEIVGCGEYVSKMSTEALGDHPTTIKNILLPKKQTHKILHLISCTRIDAHKGWNRMLKLCEMLKSAHIKFDWKIFTNTKEYRSPCEEMTFYHWKNDIWDYLADADYTVLLSDSEGLPYTVQESLQYKVPCIVTDVGGCTELIQDGINGYVVPLDMNFDVTKLLNIPKCKEYDNHALEDWLKYLNYKGKIDKNEIIQKSKEEKQNMVKVKVIRDFTYSAFDEIEETLIRANQNGNQKGYLRVNDTFECDEQKADYLTGNNAYKSVVVEILETFENLTQNDFAIEDNNQENVKPLQENQLKTVSEKITKLINKTEPSKKKKSKK